MLFHLQKDRSTKKITDYMRTKSLLYHHLHHLHHHSLISRINEVYVFFNKISQKRNFIEKNINFSYNRLFCCNHTVCYCDGMVSVTSASRYLLFNFINLTQVHNFTVSAQGIFTVRRLSVFTVRFTGILQVVMQIMKRFVPSY